MISNRKKRSKYCPQRVKTLSSHCTVTLSRATSSDLTYPDGGFVSPYSHGISSPSSFQLQSLLGLCSPESWDANNADLPDGPAPFQSRLGALGLPSLLLACFPPHPVKSTEEEVMSRARNGISRKRRSDLEEKATQTRRESETGTERDTYQKGEERGGWEGSAEGKPRAPRRRNGEQSHRSSSEDSVS